MHTTFAKSILFAFLFFSPCFAQLEIKSGVRQRVENASNLKQIGDVILLESSEAIKTTTVGIVTIETEAANIQIDVSDSNRQPFAIKKIADKVYLIDSPGKWWIDVTVIDFQKNLYGRKSAVLEFGGGPPTPPTPDPPPNPPPTPPSPVPNAYGIGAIAYKNAPKDRVGAAKYASLYRQAGDFLFGIPTLKFIVSDNESHNRDPNRCVLAWLKQQFDLVQCPDQAICAAWKTWQIKVRDAFSASQTSRQYTKQDWYNAFNEIADAMEVPK